MHMASFFFFFFQCVRLNIKERLLFLFRVDGDQIITWNSNHCPTQGPWKIQSTEKAIQGPPPGIHYIWNLLIAGLYAEQLEVSRSPVLWPQDPRYVNLGTRWSTLRASRCSHGLTVWIPGKSLLFCDPLVMKELCLPERGLTPWLL